MFIENPIICDIIYGEGEFGSSISLPYNIEILAVGGPGEYKDSGEWNQIGGDNEGVEPTFSSVILSRDGTKFALGEPDSLNGGQVRVFRFDYIYQVSDESTSLLSGNTEGCHLFGSRILFSGDRKRLAVTAKDEYDGYDNKEWIV